MYQPTYLAITRYMQSLFLISQVLNTPEICNYQQYCIIDQQLIKLTFDCLVSSHISTYMTDVIIFLIKNYRWPKTYKPEINLYNGPIEKRKLSISLT